MPNAIEKIEITQPGAEFPLLQVVQSLYNYQ
jgi:hypothetical protein